MENSHLEENLTNCNFCYVFNSAHSIINHCIIRHLTNLVVVGYWRLWKVVFGGNWTCPSNAFHIQFTVASSQAVVGGNESDKRQGSMVMVNNVQRCAATRNSVTRT